MFGWFRKNEKQKLAEAYELGGRIAESANADVEAYMQERFYPQVQMIAEGIYGDFERPDLPPPVVARIDLKYFLEHLDEDVRPRVLPRLLRAMAKWDKAMKEIGAGAEFEQLIEHHYNGLKCALA